MQLVKTIGCLLMLIFCSSSFGQIGYKKLGLASFYHDSFNGKRTANGEIFSQQKLTCAHRTFPMGTRLKVTNIDNGKSVVVRVNDRGPYARNRIIDLTSTAAKRLDFIQDGQCIVALEIVSSEGKSDSLYYIGDSLQPFFQMMAMDDVEFYSLKIGSYLLEHKVLEMIQEVKRRTGLDTYVQTVAFNNNILYRVFAGRFDSQLAARETLDKFVAAFPDAYVVQISKRNDLTETR